MTRLTFEYINKMARRTYQAPAMITALTLFMIAALVLSSPRSWADFEPTSPRRVANGPVSMSRRTWRGS